MATIKTGLNVKKLLIAMLFSQSCLLYSATTSLYTLSLPTHHARDNRSHAVAVIQAPSVEPCSK